MGHRLGLTAAALKHTRLIKDDVVNVIDVLYGSFNLWDKAQISAKDLDATELSSRLLFTLAHHCDVVYVPEVDGVSQPLHSLVQGVQHTLSQEG
ncbi:hypothetical protein ES703_79874 [subsurface metagenome]